MTASIVLNHNGVFHPEEVMEGKVICVFKSREEIRGIRLILRGKEHTSWEKRESYYDQETKKRKNRPVHYSGDNEFLQMQQTLHGSGNINPGKYEYPFKFVLTSNIPSTYNGAHGHIRYFIRANVDIQKASGHEIERQFTVFSPINFNNMLNRIELNPTQYQDETNLCCCCCASDPITMEAFLDKEAFVLGETIRIRIHITNMTNTSIDELTVKLIRFVKEKVTHPTSDHKEEKDEILKKLDTGVGAHGKRDYNFDLKVPQDLQLPNFAASELFKQWFKLKIEASVDGCHSDMEMEMEVHLGHIPAVGSEPMQNPPIQVASLPSSPGQVYPPLYSPGGQVSSYAGVSAQPNTIGFAVPGGNPTVATPYPIAAPPGDLPGVHTTNKFQKPTSGGSSSYPTAPNDESIPTAPTKSDLANSDFTLIDVRSGYEDDEPPPPSYNDAMKHTKYCN